jgi:hypothetical protein
MRAYPARRVRSPRHYHSTGIELIKNEHRAVLELDLRTTDRVSVLV